MAKILVVDDAEETQLLVRGVLGSNHQVCSLKTGEALLQQVKEISPDLILLDVGLPDMDGFSLYEQIRDELDMPLLFLTGRRQPDDVRLGLDLGADDYITKPFHPTELKARCESRLRKGRTTKTESKDFYSFGPISVHLLKRAIFIREGAGDQELKLTPAEFQLLFLLCKNEGQALSREQIRKSLTTQEFIDVDTRVIDAQISSLRRKSTYLTRAIKSVYGVGYRLNLNASQ